MNTYRKAPCSRAFAGRIRYSFAERNKLGVEAIGSFEKGGTSTLMLGYYGEVSRSLSVNIAIGTGTGAGPDLTARTV